MSVYIHGQLKPHLKDGVQRNSFFMGATFTSYHVSFIISS